MTSWRYWVLCIQLRGSVLNQILAIVSLLVAGQGIGILLLIVSSARPRSSADYLLTAYILLNCICFFIEYFVFSGITLPNPIRKIEYLSLLEGPLFFLWVCALVTPTFRLKYWHLLHCLPLLLGLFPELLFFIDDQSLYVGFVKWTGYYCLLLGYLAACIRLLPHYNRFIRGQFSSIESFDLGWLYRLVILYFISSILLLTVRIFEYTSFLEDPQIHYIYVPNTFIFFICFYLIGMGGYRQRTPPAINRASVEGSSHSPDAEAPKYRHSTITPAECAQLQSKLNAFMCSHEPFLEENLTSLELAEALGISSYQLSQVLNTGLHQSFYDYINGYRAEKARQIIDQNPEALTPMLDIGIEAGFSNKTTFYKYFKKSFEKTPLQYKKSAIINN